MENAKNRVRVMTGIIGGIIGLISIVLPWVRFHEPALKFLGEDFTLLKLLGISELAGSRILGYESVRVFFLVVCAVLIIGSLVAFFKPWGGIIQIIGVVAFAAGISSDIIQVSVSPLFGVGSAEIVTPGSDFGGGFYTALLASVITIIGFAFKSRKK